MHLRIMVINQSANGKVRIIIFKKVQHLHNRDIVFDNNIRILIFKILFYINYV
jgi:hypothetical protein